MPTFADTSALFALLSPNDRHHREASEVAHQLVRERELIWTIDAVVVELWRLLRAEFGGEQADFLIRGLASGGLDVQANAREDYASAWQRAVDWPDQDFALADRLSFAAIERLRSYRAWSYDADFAIIRVGAARRRALDILH
jgi:predicted nucleic acid-binding protein